MDCSECDKELAVESLAGHMAKQYDVYQSFVLEEERDSSLPPSPRRWDAVYYPAEEFYRCPVPGCPQGRDGSGMWDPGTCGGIFPTATVTTAFRWWGCASVSKCRLRGMQVSTAGTPAHEASQTIETNNICVHPSSIDLLKTACCRPFPIRWCSRIF